MLQYMIIRRHILQHNFQISLFNKNEEYCHLDTLNPDLSENLLRLIVLLLSNPYPFSSKDSEHCTVMYLNNS